MDNEKNTTNSDEISWPDLSAYGITLGLVKMGGDKKQLVYADPSGKYKHVAKNMGFAKTKWTGLWVRSDSRVEAAAFRTAFPKVVVERRSISDITQKTQELIHRVIESSQQALLPGFDAVGPVQDSMFPPARTAPTTRAAELVSPPASPVAQFAPASPDVATSPNTVTSSSGASPSPSSASPSPTTSPAPAPVDTSTNGPTTSPVTQEASLVPDVQLSPLVEEVRLLGTNLSGEEVFEYNNGSRFVRFRVDNGTTIENHSVNEASRTADDLTSSRFLRANTDASLDLCSQAFVKQMSEGHIARVDELHRFFHAVTGREFTSKDPDVERVISSIDRARVNALQSSSEAGPNVQVFEKSLQLHDSAQYYSVVSTNRMTPLPIGVILQHIAAAAPEGSSVRVDNSMYGEFGAFTGQGTNPSGLKLAADGEPQNVLMGAYSGKVLDKAVQAFGTAVTREDHASVLKALEKMDPNGFGVFVVEGDMTPGRVGPSSRRFLDALANLHEIAGIVDIDGNLMGVPGATPSRLLVVGKRRETPGHGGLPTSLPYVTDYQSLWGWSSQIKESIQAPGSVPLANLGGVTEKTGEDNSYQVPYIPSSMLTDPALMIPRNLASPVRRSMLNMMEKTPHIDEWLSKTLEYPDTKSLSSALSSEQADAVALALHRTEEGLGFMVADQTGVGKGRTISSLARASRLRGDPVLFLTEKSDLFTDLWRDIEDTNSQDFFKRIFIMNEGIEIVSPSTGEVVAKSAPREEVDKVIRSMKMPEGYDMVMATYSQFNRDPVKALKNSDAIDLKDYIKSDMSESAKKLMEWMKLNRQAAGKGASKEIIVEAVSALNDPEIIKKMPLAAAKSLWIGKAPAGSALIMDESHNASGESSQTAMNLTHGVMTAKTVVYSSATFARGEKNMRIYRRLFPESVDVEGLHETLKKGGEALQESLASMLAEDGALIRREHDLSMLKFEPKIDTPRQARNEKVSDQLAEILSVMTALSRESRILSEAVSQETKDALEQTQAMTSSPINSSSVGMVKRSPIGNNLYMIMRSFLTTLKAEVAVEEAVNALKDGRKPVLVIDQTMESELNKRIEAVKADNLGIETDDGYLMKAPGFRSVLRDRLASMLRVEVDGEDLQIDKRPELKPIITQINNLIDKFPDFPTSPIDIIRQGIEKAGYNTAELSGRSKRVRYLDDGNVMVQNIGKQERKSARDRFNNGDAHAIILTRAGNAGISLHDSYRFLNRGQRELIEVEVPPDVIARMQFFGRVNRNGQMSYPLIKTLSTGLPAENRVLALQNNKLRKLSANVNGDRDNAAITKEVPDILNSIGNEVAYRFLELDPGLAKKLDIEIEARSEESNDDVTEQQSNLTGEKFIMELLNKSVLLPIKDQVRITESIFMEFQSVIEELDAKGENPLRPKFYDINAKQIESTPLELAANKDPESGKKISVFDQPVNLTKISYVHYDEPMPGKELVKLITHGQEDLKNFVDEKYSDVETYDNWKKENPDSEINDYIIESLISRKDTILEKFLSTSHSNVAEALADPDKNMVKTLDHKIDSIINLMATMKIGSRISWHNDFRDHTEEHAVVVRILPPEDDELHHAGRYRVKVALPGSAMTEHISLAALMGKKGFQVFETEFNPDLITEFDNRKRASYSVDRPVLDGNLFRAAEMSIQTGLGLQASYSDENGLTNRAIIMPLGFQGNGFNHLPLRLHDKTMVKTFFSTIETGELHSTAGAMKASVDGAKLMKKGMSIKKTPNEFIVSCPGNQQWVNWLKNNSELMEITGPFGGTRSKLFATVPLKDADKLVEMLYKTGLTMYAHPGDSCTTLNLKPGEKRESVPSYVIRQRTKTSSVRSWFADQFGADLLHVNSTDDLKKKDPFADADTAAKHLKMA